MLNKKKTFVIKVTNMVCGRVDVHHDLDYDDILWIAANPNLKIEYLQ